MSVRVFCGPLVLSLALLAACSGQTDVMPGIAHPAASASDGYRLEDGDTLHDFNGINVVLPSGWQARVSGDCLTPPGVKVSETSAPQGPSCPTAALRIRIGAAANGYIDSEGEQLDAADGWWRPETKCPSSDGPETQPILAQSTDRGSFTVVSGERVEVGEWSLTCADGARFGSRIWYIPEADLEFGVAAMVDDVSADEYDQVVRSLDLSGYVN
ncbi:hypothetical protein F4561_000592 [Lipingzhangella halophila]|uniref:Uncharacterized protein n=1 Tax=Lipingzhangella halophila TaxID=1783352 RepID=A0A7W7W0C8_9ACTN|nr:hypothetical protein [Lipingzhangella halophila]MBB4929772.1 hypothetical protein [Lipingzhangella halophila]